MVIFKAFFFNKGKFSRKLYIALLFCNLAFFNHFLILVNPAWHWATRINIGYDPSMIINTIFVSLDTMAIFSLKYYLEGKKTD